MKGIPMKMSGNLVKCAPEKRKLGMLFFVLCASSISEITSLRLTNMTAPVIQDPREDMQLFCEFDMGGEELYAVKWYKDDHEFFRFSPAGQQRLLQFEVTGVNVDLSRTKCTINSCTLMLKELSRTFSSGAYRCEVSTEAPAFRLASQTHNITVAVIPNNNPTIEGINDKYLIGDILVGTCSSGLGDPRPIITWYMNGQAVNTKYLKELPQRPGSFHHEEDKVKLRATSKQIRIPLDKKITENKPSSVIELACVQATESIASASPRSTTKIVRVSTEEQLVKNQKLYGVFGSGASAVHASLCTVLVAILCKF